MVGPYVTLRPMRRLLPPALDVPDDALDRPWEPAELAGVYAYPQEHLHGQGWLRANMVTSVDGAAHHGGRSQPLSHPADMRIFGVLRALADVVIVGAETVRQERYRPARERAEFAARRAEEGQTPVAAIAVVSASLHLDFSLPLFTEPVVPTMLITGPAAPRHGLDAARAAGAEVITVGEGAEVDPLRVKAELVRRGYTRLLTEGGPRLLGAFAEAGALDELCLTTSPRYAVGTAGRVMSGPGIEVPRELELTSLLEESGFLFGRYRRV